MAKHRQRPVVTRAECDPFTSASSCRVTRNRTSTLALAQGSSQVSGPSELFG